MFHWRLFWLVVICLPLLAGCAFEASSQPAAAAPQPVSTGGATVIASQHPPDSCTVTSPPEQPFIPPPPYHRYAPSPGEFWYGTADLWTAVPHNGVWSALPHNPEGYTQKVFWWNQDYVWKEEPQPRLTVTGRRLDDSAAPLNVSRATNAFADDIQSAMLVEVDFPTLGCWEITGRYAEAELSFVVRVAP